MRIHGKYTKEKEEVQKPASVARQLSLMETWNIIEGSTITDFVPQKLALCVSSSRGSLLETVSFRLFSFL